MMRGTYDYVRRLPKANIRKIVEILNTTFPTLEDDFIAQLSYCGLSARICYSSKSVDELIKEDEKLNDQKKLIQFLKRLSSLGHMSVFAHAINRYTITREFVDEREYLTLEDVALIIPELFVFRYHSYDSDMKFPALPIFLNTLQIINPHGIKYLSNTDELIPIDTQSVEYVRSVYEKIMNVENSKYKGWFFINLRSYLELLKLLGDEERFWERAYEKRYLIKRPNAVFSAHVPNTDNAIVHMMNNTLTDYPRKGTVIFENVSRVFSHQLVRHTSFYFEQRSLRYVKLKDDDISVFVNPSFRYNNQAVKKLYEDEYKRQLKTYHALVAHKVKAEDARFVIGQGIRTVLVMSFTEFGLDNLFYQRAENKKAQWEIREVIKIFKMLLTGTYEIDGEHK